MQGIDKKRYAPFKIMTGAMRPLPVRLKVAGTLYMLKIQNQNRKLKLWLAFGFLWIFPLVATTVSPGLAESLRAPPPKNNAWIHLEPGLDLALFPSSKNAAAKNSGIRVLRIDPKFFRFTLVNASALKPNDNRSVKRWAADRGLVAAVNASMFQEDAKTSVSLMRTGGHVNNRRLSKDKTILAFDPLDKSLPKVQIIDRQCQSIDKLGTQYQTAVQSIRMVSCKGKNVWKQNSKKWSVSAVGADREGNILFIHSGTPQSAHDLIERLQRLPIKLARAMYTEGGPSAQLYVRSNDKEYDFLGEFSTRLRKNETSRFAFPVPNVVGIQRIAPNEEP